MIPRYSTAFALLMLYILDVSATTRIADAEVGSLNGVPCFTISLREENRNGQPLLGALAFQICQANPRWICGAFS